MNTIADNELLGAALVGYQSLLRTINEKIQEIRSELRGPEKAVVASDDVTPKRQMSAGARKRMATAQKKRWAAYRAQKTAA
jgi:hypothetical protein